MHKFKLLLVALPLVFFHKIILNPNEMMFPAHDIIGIYSFEKYFFVNSVMDYGTFPLWNPYVFSGVTFIGNPWSSMFYPLSLLYFLFPTDLVFGYLFVLDIFLLGFFTYLFSRIIKLQIISSIFSATILMLSGPIIMLFYPGHLLILDTFIWFPLLLLFCELYLLKREILYVTFAGLVLGIMFLAGHTQIAIYATLAYFIYFSLRIIFDGLKINNLSHIKDWLLLLIIPIAIGFSLAAIQLLPTIELSRLSARSDGLSYEFASDFSLHPKQLISFILPHFFGSPLDNIYWGKGNFESSTGYLGILPLVLVIIALIFIRNKHKNIFTILGLFALIYSFGKYSFLFPFFYHNVPGFDSFRVSARFLPIYAFSLSILSGFGVDFLTTKQKNLKNLAKFTLVTASLKVIVLISIAFMIFSYFKEAEKLFKTYVLRNSFAQGFEQSKLYTLIQNDFIFFTVIIITIFFLFISRIKNVINNKIFIILLFLIAVVDLFFFGYPFINTKNSSKIYKQHYLIDTIKKDKDNYRVFDMPGKLLPLLQRSKLESLTGIHSIYLRDYRDLLWSVGKHENKPYESFFEIYDVSHPMVLDLLNTKYIISNHELKLPQYKKILKPRDGKNDKNQFYLYENKNVLPRAYMLSNAMIVKDKTNILNKIVDESFNSKETVLLEKDPNVPLQNHSAFETVDIKMYEPNKITLSSNLQKPGFLVLSEMWYPGWKAFDNGKEKEIYRANYLFRSIYLEKGGHEIMFIYDPKYYKVGKVITLFTLIICCAFILFKKINLVKTTSKMK